MARTQRNRKTSVRLWAPLGQRLATAMDRVGLKRDAYLSRVLEVELPRLESEITGASSVEAQRYVALMLRRLGKPTLLTLNLPGRLLDRLDVFCERRRVCRDAFFNRLVFLLTATPTVLDIAFFEGDAKWRADVWSECKHDGPFFENVFYPLDPVVDPFWAIRAGLALRARGKRSSDATVESLYTASLCDLGIERGKSEVIDLTGLSCYLPDSLVPHTRAFRDSERRLRTLLGDDMFRKLS